MKKRLLGALLLAVVALATWFGVRALREWKAGSERAGCLMNIRNVQQACRGMQGMGNLSFGDPIDWEQIFLGPRAFLKEPVCPAGGTYTFSRFHPRQGELACTCSLAASHGHVPDNHDDW